MKAWVTAWLVSMALWLVLVGSFAPAELAAGVVAAAGAATAGYLARSADAHGVRLAGSDLVALSRVPAASVRDSVAVLAAIARQLAGGDPVRGRLVRVPDRAPPDPAGAVGHHLMTTLVVGSSPNTYVAGFEGGSALVHQLLRR